MRPGMITFPAVGSTGTIPAIDVGATRTALRFEEVRTGRELAHTRFKTPHDVSAREAR